MGILTRGLDDTPFQESKNQFSIGDIVQHKATGEKGVIIHIYTGGPCANPEHNSLIHCVHNSSECQKKLIDCYDVSVSFEKTVKQIDGLLLKKGL